MAEVKSETKLFSECIKSEFLEEKCTSNKNPQSLITENNGFIYYWSNFMKCIYIATIAEPVDETKQRKVEEYFQILLPSVSILFDVTTIQCSPSGHYILLHGPHGVAVVEVPRKWGGQDLLEGGKSTIHCRIRILDESFFLHHVSIKIVQVRWYKGSPDETHLLLLSTDNCVRFYDVNFPEQPMLRLPLSDQNATKSDFLNGYANVLGETVTDFDVGSPSEDQFGVDTYPIYVMQENGDVWALYCKFAQNRFQVEQRGPLTMNPPSADNYGCNYSSLTCLQTTPCTLIMAAQSGIIHHCLVLENNNDEDSEVQLNDLDRSFGKCAEQALYVYESVQLEMTFLYGDEEEDENTGSKPSNVLLKTDNVHSNCYVVLSKGGVHLVWLPWLQDLDCLCPEVPAEVAYLLCTQPSTKSPATPVCGCLLHKRSSVKCLLSTGEFIDLAFNSPSPIAEITKARSSAPPRRVSPLRQLKATGSFDEYIARLLMKNATVPLIRCGDGTDLIPADEYYKLLTATTQILREEYLQKMLQAKMEIDKRCTILRSKKEEQLADITRLQVCSLLSEKSETLAAKLESAQANMLSITTRANQLLRHIRSSSTVMTSEEREWNGELKRTNEKLNTLRRTTEIVKSKRENMILSTVPAVQKSRSRKPALTPAQVIKVRAVLREQENAITKLIEESNSLQRKFGR